jgi:glycosyltransferase involved in cell wall biosynthesis
LKVLLVGRFDGWKGIYLRQVAAAFTAVGAPCSLFDYRKRGILERLRRRPRSEAEVRRSRSHRLIRAAKIERPDLIVTTALRLDFALLQDRLPCTVAHWDMDGPTVGFVGVDSLEAPVDFAFTVAHSLTTDATTPRSLHFLPHGADLDYYAPGPVKPALQQRFAAELAFVGKPCPRRQQMLAQLASPGLAVWGGRWQQSEWNEDLEGSIREAHNIEGPDLVQLFRASGLVLNILRESFTTGPAVANLQVFMVPASGVCLLTEWVDGLDELYELDREVVAFHSTEELLEKAAYFVEHPAERQAIAAAGRRRCERDHSLEKRAQRILSIVQGSP